MQQTYTKGIQKQVQLRRDDHQELYKKLKFHHTNN